MCDIGGQTHLDLAFIDTHTLTFLPSSPCRDVSVSVSAPKSVLQYWSSVTLQRGLECGINQGVFSINYRVKIIPYEGEEYMYKRESADWTISSCEGEVKDLTVHVHKRAEQREVSFI